jgi:hypothetical protein
MAVPERTNKEKERREGKVTNVKLRGFAFLVSSCSMLSEILHYVFQKLAIPPCKLHVYYTSVRV